MNKENLLALIDRVIGKKGILRSPSYWVSKVLYNIIDYVDNVLQTSERAQQIQINKNADDVAFFANYPQERYLTALALEDGMTASYTLDYYYRINNGSWVYAEANSTTPSVNKGERISFKAEPTLATLEEKTGCGRFSFSKKIDLLGTPLSMLNGDRIVNDTLPVNHTFSNMFSKCPVVRVAKDFLPTLVLTKQQEYKGMFYECEYLIEAPDLPATTLSLLAYSEMFGYCKSLVNAPKLPCMNLNMGCYSRMFRHCTSLVNAPELPATVLDSQCYQGMFWECTSLVNAPELLATRLSILSYDGMFEDCSSLNYVKMLATDVSAQQCLNNWMLNVSPSGTFVKAAGVEIPTGASGIPEGWTVEEVAV